ncbi:phenylalanine--tRNA ligase subunit alpha [Candidatus Roizmanbacteria bacterium CG22_combo_CG10-13_8_21_14_all_34_12]|uniref:Phenylalanine--tRNA ligase alpha subunit n=1 Tax=Candidatus Roizmanbacteria bacterium CG22_combo_CG10-13_8_21_14_all_34_12 TaxID=1974860 RepID=A0A2H0C1J2_9BACT|nr:MAG: phenylalanine--tRNA ligase subunit alpha [Candidatus Roizmanbacteria bacterium CG22_combo_CG10-13_8_21_14_all_34_12]
MVDVGQITKLAEKEIKRSVSLDVLSKLEIKYLGRNGEINKLLSAIKNIPDEQKKTYGQRVNKLKASMYRYIETRKKELQNKKSGVFFDKTLPGKTYPKGSLHIVSFAIEEITKVFEKIGFIRVSYPEVDWEYGAFESLNMPVNHPARDDVETSFIDMPAHPKLGKMVLTPHTSNGQNREMKRVGKPPIRMINISKCYRPNWDATHTPMFHQFEGLCVDKDISIVNLKGTLDYFAEKYFGVGTKTRLRPHHFQFTEPSFEVDISCNNCGGTGIIKANRCKVCKSGWLELGGTGMVHPNVLREGGIDPSASSGWAFGFGIERVIMMKYGLDDIRNYYSGDIRFLEQF